MPGISHGGTAESKRENRFEQDRHWTPPVGARHGLAQKGHYNKQELSGGKLRQIGNDVRGRRLGVLGKSSAGNEERFRESTSSSPPTIKKALS
jgi:hypothetical protein